MKLDQLALLGSLAMGKNLHDQRSQPFHTSTYESQWCMQGPLSCICISNASQATVHAAGVMETGSLHHPSRDLAIRVHIPRASAPNRLAELTSMPHQLIKADSTVCSRTDMKRRQGIAHNGPGREIKAAGSTLHELLSQLATSSCHWY